MIEDKLPRVASELLEVALRDMKLTIQSGINIKMDKWGANLHTPETCAVCFAGGVMLNTLSLPKFNYGFGEWSKRLSFNDSSAILALDNFRSGSIHKGLMNLSVDLSINKYLEPRTKIVGWTQYEDCENDEQFYTQIEDLIIFLKNQDL